MTGSAVPDPTAPRHASLPMYDWPEARAQVDAHWAALRRAVLTDDPRLDLPTGLFRPESGGALALWRDPGCVFSQTCWGPLSLGLIEYLKPLAQPDYSAFAGGRGPFYRSAIIARQGQPATVPNAVPDAVPDGPGPAVNADLLRGRVLAVNGTDSLSGFLSLRDDLGADPRALAADWLETGSHRASVRAVAQGKADIAAIDCRSWALARAHEACAGALVVVGWTRERWGLPYVTHRSTPARVAQALRKVLMQNGCHDAPDDKTGRRE